MRGKFIAGMTAGALVGAAMGMMVPGMDRNTKRRIRRTAKNMRNTAGDVLENVIDLMK